MRPPICAICGNNLFGESRIKGDTVKFALTKEEEQFNAKFEEPGFVGHPAGLEWFCEKHLSDAQALQHLTWSEARGKLMNHK